ncbi:MAG: LEPR-XLL domain-containing protein, partial [Phycisphaerales bacterium]
MSLHDRVARLQHSVSARLAGLMAGPSNSTQARDARPGIEALEDRLLLSATLLVDAGADVNSDEGSQVSLAGTFEDTDAGGGGTPGVFDVLQLTSTGDDEQQMDIDGDRAVWVSNSDIFFFDGTFDAVTLAPNIINLTSTLSSNASDPHISGNHIVYAGGGIKAYDIVSGVTTTLASGFSVANPEIDGDIAVWTERPGSFFNITMADLSAATPVPIAVFPVGSGPGATGNQLDPKISGDNIIWLAPGVGGFNDVFIHNLTTGITTNVSNSAVEDTGHQIDDGVVVWSNSASGDSDVYVFDGRGFDGTGTAPTAINLGAAGISDVV